MCYPRQFVYATLCSLLLLLGGCSGLLGPGRPGDTGPLRSDRFALPPEGTDVVGQLQVARARYEDTLPDIARRYSLGYEEIVAANPGIDPWLPGEGTEILLPTAFVLPPVERRGLVLNLAAMRLFYYPEPAQGQPAEVITYPIGIGREGWETPLGEFHVIEKREKPTWTVPASVRKEHAEAGDPLPAVVPAGPDNPLGDYAMRLSLPSYLIHGTNQPWGVGMRVSHGCVRLYPEDIARLFPSVPKNTPVVIINEPYLAGWRDGQLYLEAHVPLAEDDRPAREGAALAGQALAERAEHKRAALDTQLAAAVSAEGKGIPVAVLSGAPSLAEAIASAPRVTSTPPWAPLDYAAEGEEAQAESAAAEPAPEACDPAQVACNSGRESDSGIRWGVPAVDVASE